ncbi:unnamed protein product [Euphydryas editha]|uniref:Uncharacterized protein n=1 Tax=Euphydryas editha TaxID=104508 RepID=A0AAU9TWD1_EUPED|nr:unnamed protein product [Euphydryas editha]
MMNTVLREIVARASIESKQRTEYQQICLKHECHDLNELETRIKTIKEVDNEDMANNSGLNGLYRPRSALARALYEKQRNDRHLQEFDQNEVRKCTTVL